ncbi:MAG: hypothetical protein A3K59_10675 [Euryarchaeota archaeon RBG_19FT_COMBO_69_17]|nr:MAG: hypothetical protein A3K59_10675 [Euryarchaeota archaeon RBG_19FT_COMBO_69_17]
MALPGFQDIAAAGPIIGVVLLLVGLALAFWGHGIWASVMSMIGALLGSSVGYLFGAAAGGGYVTGLVLAAIGAIIGSILFTKLIKVALAFLVGVLAGAAVYALLGGTAVFTSGQIDMPLVAALLVLLVVFALAYYYIDDLIGVITAAIGGLLLALGIYLLGVTTNVVAALAGLGAFVLGAYVQTKAIRRKRAMRAMAQPPAAAPTPPPPPPPPR